MSSSLSFTMPFLSLFLLSIFCVIAQATVPPNATFKYVNEGEFGQYIVEYDGSYRDLRRNRHFYLCFTNTTPNAFTLALHMGTKYSTSVRRWVWEANKGNPVRENATLTFGTDGNLVLAYADGRVAWQTNTANKGVVRFNILPNGNMVLRDSKDNFIWQSFDYPTDTLWIGQSLRAKGPIKLVSRTSAEDNRDGPYSLVLEPKGLGLYYKSNNSPRPILYSSELLTIQKGSLENVTLFTRPDTDEGYAYDLGLDFYVANSPFVRNRYFSRPKYNATFTFLRLGIDGNIRLYTFYDEVDWGAWEVTYNLFDRDWAESECQLPERCGNFGLCEDNQCVACPLSTGLVGWSKDCKPKKLTSCGVNDFQYYKLEGVDHFMSKYNKGDGVTEVSCGKKCSADCKCLGYFYHRETSKCWIAYDLKTLTKFVNSTHVGYIKEPKH